MHGLRSKGAYGQRAVGGHHTGHGSSERTSLELADAILSQGAPGDGLTGLLHCSLEQLQSIRGVGM